MNQDELTVITIPDAKRLAGASLRHGVHTLAIQTIRDQMDAAAILEMFRSTDAGGATFAIANTDQLQLRLVDNSDEDAPNLLGAIAIDPEQLTDDQKKVIAMSQALARGFVNRFEAALAALQDGQQQLALIELMKRIAGETNDLMKEFVGQRIFNIKSDIPRIEFETRAKFDRWSNQLSGFELLD